MRTLAGLAGICALVAGFGTVTVHAAPSPIFKPGDQPFGNSYETWAQGWARWVRQQVANAAGAL